MPSSKLWLQYRRRWTCPLMLPCWLAMLQLMRREVVLVITTSQPDHYRLERPKLQAGCPRADWLGRFFSKVEAANAATDKISHQLLGCLDHDLSALVYNEHAAPETVKLQGCIFYLLGLITFCWLLFFFAGTSLAFIRHKSNLADMDWRTSLWETKWLLWMRMAQRQSTDTGVLSELWVIDCVWEPDLE